MCCSGGGGGDGGFIEHCEQIGVAGVNCLTLCLHCPL